MRYAIDRDSAAGMRLDGITSNRKLKVGDVLEIVNRFGHVQHIVQVADKKLNEDEEVELTLVGHETIRVQGTYG
jgi:hypothetical protein